MICAEESASTDRQRLLDPTRPMREPVRYRTAAGVARAVLGRARNRQTAARALPGACDPAFFSLLGIEDGWCFS